MAAIPAMAWTVNDDSHHIAWAPGGGSWAAGPYEVLYDRQAASAPALVRHDGTFYMAWVSLSESQIQWSRLEGGRWSAPASAGFQSPAAPALGSDGDRVFMAWKSKDVDPGSHDDSALMWSYLEQEEWQPERTVSSTSHVERTGHTPSLSAVGGTLYLAWRGPGTGVGPDERLFWTRSDTQWFGGEDHVAYPIGEGRSAWGPSLAALNDTLYMAWRGWTEQSDDTRIFWSRLNGDQWEPQRHIDGLTQTGPALAAADGVLYVAWKGRDLDARIFWSAFDPSSLAWAPQEVLPDRLTNYTPALA